MSVDTTRTWTFNSDLEDFSVVSSANVTAVFDGSNGSPANGCLKIASVASNGGFVSAILETPYKTWKVMFPGVPSDATRVNYIKGTIKFRLVTATGVDFIDGSNSFSLLIKVSANAGVSLFHDLTNGETPIASNGWAGVDSTWQTTSLIELDYGGLTSDPEEFFDPRETPSPFRKVVSIADDTDIRAKLYFVVGFDNTFSTGDEETILLYIDTLTLTINTDGTESVSDTTYGITDNPYTLSPTKIVETDTGIKAFYNRIAAKAQVGNNFLEMWYYRNSAWYLMPSETQPVFQKDISVSISHDYQMPDEANISIADGLGLLATRNYNSAYNYVGATYDPIIKETRKIILRAGRKCYNNLAVTPTSTLAPSAGTLNLLADNLLGTITAGTTNYATFSPASTASFTLKIDLADIKFVRHLALRFGSKIGTCTLPAAVQFSFSEDDVTYHILPVIPVAGNATVPGDYNDDYTGYPVEICKTDIEYRARYIKATITPTGAQTIMIDEFAVLGENTFTYYGYNVFTGFVGDSIKYDNLGNLKLKVVGTRKKLQDNYSTELTLQYSNQDAADIIYSLLTNPTYWHGTGERYDTPISPSGVLWSSGSNYAGFIYPVWQGQQANIDGYIQEIANTFGADLITNGNGQYDILQLPYRQFVPDRVLIADNDGCEDVKDCERDDSGKDIRNIISVKTSDDIQGANRTVSRLDSSILEFGERFFGITDPLLITQDFREKVGEYALRDYGYRTEMLHFTFRPDALTRVKRIFGIRASGKPSLYAKDSNVTGKLRKQELWSIEGYDEVITPGEWRADAQAFPYYGLGPGRPLNITATPNPLLSSEIDIEFDDPSDADIVTNHIYQSNNEFGPFVEVATNAATPSAHITVAIGGLTPGNTYWFYATVDGRNGVQSLPSSIVGAVAGLTPGDDSKWTITDLNVAFVQSIPPTDIVHGYYEYEFYFTFTSPPVIHAAIDDGMYGFKHCEYRLSPLALPTGDNNKPDSWIYIDEWHGPRVPPGKTWDRTSDGYLYFYARFRVRTAFTSGQRVYFRFFTWQTTEGMHGPPHPSNIVFYDFP